MEKTPNYNLNKPGYENFGDVDALNENFEKIDETLGAHTSDKSNPHSVTASQIGAATSADLKAHTDSKNNPHGVTAEQVGAMRALSQPNCPVSFENFKALAPGIYYWVSMGDKEWMPARLSSLSGNIRFELTVKNAGNQNFTYVLRCIDGAANLDEFIGELGYKDGVANGSVRWTEIATLKDGPRGAVFRAKHQSVDCESDTAVTYLRDTAFDTAERTPSTNGTIIWQYG